MLHFIYSIPCNIIKYPKAVLLTLSETVVELMAWNDIPFLFSWLESIDIQYRIYNIHKTVEPYSAATAPLNHGTCLDGRCSGSDPWLADAGGFPCPSCAEVLTHFLPIPTRLVLKSYRGEPFHVPLASACSLMGKYL